MGLVLARVDERLVHGQIITSWTKYLNATDIYIIDDGLSEDKFMKEILELSAPSGLIFSIYNVEEGLKKLNTLNNEKVKVILLFKSVKTVVDLVNKGYELESLNLGNIGSSPNKKKLTRNISMSVDEIQDAKKLINLGVEVYTQMLYTDKKVDLLILI